MAEPEGREQKLQFIKYCLGGGAVLLVFFVTLSFLQEIIKRKYRAWRLKRNARPALCSSDAHLKTQDDSEAAMADIRNSLVIKKYECDETEADSTYERMSSGTLPSTSHDVEGGVSAKEGSMTDSSSSDESTAPVTPARRISSVLRRSVSSLSEALKDPPPPPARKGPSEHEVCRLCDVQFVNGDDICESGNKRCKHQFHHRCIKAWLPYQNTCPSCSETFVVLDM